MSHLCVEGTPMSGDSLETIYVLNPFLVLRPDKKRTVLFHADPVERGKNPFTKFLSPTAAIFLSLFDGNRSLQAVITLWAEIRGHGYTEALRDAIEILEAHRDLDEELLIPKAQLGPGQYRVYHATDFLISPPSSVDLTSPRCYRPIGYTHEVCYQCVTQCRYCYSDLPLRRGSLLPLPRLREIVDEARQLGIPCVSMSGGDPFCHPQIFEVLDIYGAAGIRVDVPTKTPLKESQLQRLSEMPLVRLQFSLDGVEPRINDWLVGVSGHTERMLRTLRLTKKLKLRFSCNSVLTPYNYKEAAELIPFLMENYGEQIKRISLTPYGQSIYRHDERFSLPVSAISYVQDKVAHYKEKYPGPHISFSGGIPESLPPDFKTRKKRYDERSQCTANRTGFVMLPDGKVTVCEELYYHPAFLIGDLAAQSIMEMWESTRATALINPVQGEIPDGPCATCPDFQSCHSLKGRCYKKTLQAYGHEKPLWPDPSCPYAPSAV